MAQVTAIKRNSGKWQYRFEGASVDGKRKRYTKGGFKTKKEALEAGTKALNEYNNTGFSFIPSEISFNDYIDLWMNQYCKINLKKSTIYTYEKRLNNHILPAFGKYKLKAITPTALQEFINDLFNKGFSRTSLINFKGILSEALNYAVEPCQFIQENPMIYVKVPSPRASAKNTTRKKERVPVTDEQWTKIIERFPEGHPSFVPLQLAYRCGLRLGETFALTWNDIDFKNNTLKVDKQIWMDETTKHWTFSAPKYESSRTILIDSTMKKILKKAYKKSLESEIYYAEYYIYYRKNENNQLIECLKNELPINCNNLRLINIRENGTFVTPRTMMHTCRIIHGKTKSDPIPISKDFDYHSLRHTHATKLLEHGANPKAVQDRLGHKTIQVTLDIYTHVTKKMQEDALSVIESAF